MSIKKCPGLKITSGSKWWIPIGKGSDDMTLCEACKPIDGDYFLCNELSMCNCDGFLLNNIADNGIFNVSFWHNDETEFLPVHRIPGCNTMTFDLRVLVGTRFKLFIDGENLKQDQFFKYQLFLNNVQLKADPFYYKKSVIDNNFLKIITASPECQIHIAEAMKTQHLVTDGMRISVKLMVYTLEKMAVDQSTNEYYGDYTMMDNKTLGQKPQPHVSAYLNMIRPEYKFSGTVIAQGKMKPFTTQPLEFNFIVQTYGTCDNVNKFVAKLVAEANRALDVRRAKCTQEQEDIRKQLDIVREKAAALPLNF